MLEKECNWWWRASPHFNYNPGFYDKDENVSKLNKLETSEKGYNQTRKLSKTQIERTKQPLAINTNKLIKRNEWLNDEDKQFNISKPENINDNPFYKEYKTHEWKLRYEYSAFCYELVRRQNLDKLKKCWPSLDPNEKSWLHFILGKQMEERIIAVDDWENLYPTEKRTFSDNFCVNLKRSLPVILEDIKDFIWTQRSAYKVREEKNDVPKNSVSWNWVELLDLKLNKVSINETERVTIFKANFFISKVKKKVFKAINAARVTGTSPIHISSEKLKSLI